MMNCINERYSIAEAYCNLMEWLKEKGFEEADSDIKAIKTYKLGSVTIALRIEDNNVYDSICIIDSVGNAENGDLTELQIHPHYLQLKNKKFLITGKGENLALIRQCIHERKTVDERMKEFEKAFNEWPGAKTEKERQEAFKHMRAYFVFEDWAMDNGFLRNAVDKEIWHSQNLMIVAYSSFDHVIVNRKQGGWEEDKLTKLKLFSDHVEIKGKKFFLNGELEEIKRQTATRRK